MKVFLAERVEIHRRNHPVSFPVSFCALVELRAERNPDRPFPTKYLVFSGFTMKPRVLFVVLMLLAQVARAQAVLHADSWEEVYRTRRGDITIFWYTSRPFIYQERDGDMRGIEVEIMQSFAAYLRNAHKIDL